MSLRHAVGCYIILRGPLGVGKTTVAAALSDAIGAKVVSVDALVDPDWDGGSLRLYLRANVRAAAVAKPTLVRGRPVVFDGCFYWKTQLRDLERRMPYPHLVVTLTAPLRMCVERDAGRKVVHGTDAARTVYRKVTRFAYGIPIDATRRVSDMVRDIRSHLPSS